ncbi:glycosyltransferase family 4 protein [Cupriavidus sp. KK10]|uniref:glycosyltransferase family 4 protein n=1 Tax=Cupriavidus TaxID=106589 RepID=UPI001BAA0856|nr:glycosyltransferase family 4 protein [Cupriavidus sp. KK10]QUN31572.1 glycosyltransferase family 4 protein [Cupriavidus sp. KK10]
MRDVQARRAILFCANTAWSMYQFRRGLLASLIRDGYEVHVVAPEDPEVAALRAMGCIVHPLTMSAQGRNPFQDIRLVATLLALYLRVRPALIFHYTIKPNIYGSIAARLAGIRSIAVTTGLGYVFINKGLVSILSKMLYRIALRFSGQVWFLNQEDRLAFVSARLVDGKKCTVLPGEGIDLDFFAPVADVNEPAPDQFCFLLIARMLWDKGVGEYVAAARALKAKYRHVRFQMVGPAGGESPSAIPQSQVDAWVKEGVVEYLGTVRDIRPVIGAASCVVLPSYREGIPRALLEAAAMERPIVATAVPGCVDVVDHEETGLLCRERDPRDLAAKMEAMMERDREGWRRMGVAGRAKMQSSFDEKFIIEHYRNVIHALV